MPQTSTFDFGLPTFINFYLLTVAECDDSKCCPHASHHQHQQHSPAVPDEWATKIPLLTHAMSLSQFSPYTKRKDSLQSNLHFFVDD